MNYIILDLETTGLHPNKGDVIIDVAAIKCTNDGIIERFQSYVNPEGHSVSDFVYKLTHTSEELLAKAPLAKDVIPKLEAFLGTDFVLVGHNISFDANFLSYYGVSIHDSQLLDTNDFAALLIPRAPSHSLEVLSEYLNFIHEGKHTAMGDVMACYHLLGYMYQSPELNHLRTAGEKVCNKIPDWGGNHFWDIPEGMFTQQYERKSFPLEKDVDESLDDKTQPLLLSPGIAEEIVICDSLLQQKDNSVVILPKQRVKLFEKYLEYAEGPETIYFLPYISSRVSIAKVTAYTTHDHYAVSEAVLLLRSYYILSQYGDRVTVPKYLFAFTYRERSQLSHILCQTIDELTDISSKVITTYGTYYHEGLKEMLKSYETTIYGADCKEISIIKEATTMIYESYLQRLIGTIEYAFTDDAKEAKMDIESLRRLVFYFYQNIVKLSQSLDATYVSSDEMAMLLDPMSNTLPKALDILKHHIEKHQLGEQVGHTFEHLRELLLLLISHENMAVKYANIYNNEAKLLIEPTHVDEILKHTEEAKHIDSMFLLDKERRSMPDASKSQDIFFDATPLSSTENFISFLLDQKKTIVITNKGSDREQWFHALYDTHNSDDFRVLSYGHSGGGGKVEYMFKEAKRGVLFVKSEDYLNLSDMMHASTLCIASLPFAVITERYFTDKYGKSSFMSISVPVLSHIMHDCISKLQRIGNVGAKTIIMDDRLWTKRYCGDVMSMLETQFNVIR